MTIPYDTQTNLTILHDHSLASLTPEKSNQLQPHNDIPKPCCGHATLHFGIPKRLHIHGPQAQDPAEWMRDFEQLARANSWSSKAKFDIAPVYFEEKSAKAWFEDHREEWADDFEVFKLAFKERFGKDSSGRFIHPQARQDQYQLRMTWTKYIGIYLLCNVIFLTVVSFFIKSSDKEAPK